MGIEKLFDQPTFIISLDTESIWGYIAYLPSKAVSLMESDDTNGRGCIDILLNLFQKHNIPATWAVVGHLFLDHCECEDGIPHKDMPRFKEDWYSLDPCTDIQKDPLYYGKDIIEKILSNRIEHEIGYHSFSHIIFSECRREVAEAEIKEGVKLAKDFSISLKSFVFPENKLGHVNVLKKYVFKIYRGRNLGRYDLNQSFLIRKFNGGIDKMIAPPTEPKWMGGIWEIPGSMMFCDPQIKFSVLPRAKLGLYRAIRSKKVFHIYLHPHDLLMYPSLKDDLDKFLALVSKKRDEGKIEVMTMGKFADVLDGRMRNNYIHMNQTWSVRACKEGDENGIFELTKVVWGEQVPEKEQWIKGWRWMHVENPAGISRIWLAEDDGKLVGQYPVIMENMKVDGEIMKGAQLVDTMTHPKYRRRGIAFTLGKKVLSEVENGRVQLVYCFPTQQAYPLHIKSGWLDVCAFQVMIKPLNLKNILQKHFVHNRLLLNIFTVGGTIIIRALFKSKKVSDDDTLKVRKISHFDDRINEFWNRVSSDYNIIRIRDKKYLNWRYVDAPNADYTIYVAEEEGEICGYIILGCNAEDGLICGYIYDIIAPTSREDILHCLIAKVVEYFKEERADIIFSQMVPNKIYRKALLKSGFIPHFWSKSRFIAYNASTKLSEAFIKNPKNWFIQLGDLPSVY